MAARPHNNDNNTNGNANTNTNTSTPSPPTNIDAAHPQPIHALQPTSTTTACAYPHAFSMRSPADEEDIDAEFLGEGREMVGGTASAKRAAMLASRSKDPGVIVDVPREPTAEEVQAARSGEGMITPALAQGEFGS